MGRYATVPMAPLLVRLNAGQRALKLGGTSFKRWRRDGLPLYVADRLAVNAGLHPADVWGEAWWDACNAQSEHEEAAHEARLARQRAARIRVAS